MARAFVIDVGRCCGCYNCQLACKDEHVDNDWTPYAKPQPDTGQFWLKIQENVCGTVPKVRMHYIPRLCNHCANAPLHRLVPGRSHLEAGRRTGDHRAGEVHRVRGLRDGLPVRGHLFQRRTGPRAEVYGLRASARQRLQTAPLCRILPDGRHTLRRGGRPAGAHRRRRRAQAGDGEPAARLLPEHTRQVHQRHGVRPGRAGGRHRRPLPADLGRQGRRDLHRCLRRLLVQRSGGGQVRREYRGRWVHAQVLLRCRYRQGRQPGRDTAHRKS